VTRAEAPPAARCGHVVVKPAIERQIGGRVRFVDGWEERIDQIVYATRYRISLPFLSSSLPAADGRDLSLYRRIAAPAVRGLFLAGSVAAPGGLLPVVETQEEWIAAVLTGRLRLPPRVQMDWAIERAERRTRRRFPQERPPQRPLRPARLPAAPAVRPAPSAAAGMARSVRVEGRERGDRATGARTARTASRVRRKER
jgi:Flavin-binding monooxygenase-like